MRDTILNGDSSHDGLKAIVAERNQADLGIVGAIAPAIDPPSTGRLVLAGAGQPTTLTEDSATSPFGFKFSAANPPTSTSANIAVSGPSGSPAGISVNVTGQPVVGDKITITLTLPDATTTTLTLTASSSVTTKRGGLRREQDAVRHRRHGRADGGQPEFGHHARGQCRRCDQPQGGVLDHRDDRLLRPDHGEPGAARRRPGCRNGCDELRISADHPCQPRHRREADPSLLQR